MDLGSRTFLATITECSHSPVQTVRRGPVATTEAWLRLNCSGIAPSKQLELVRSLGSPEAILCASDAELGDACPALTRNDLAKMGEARTLETRPLIEQMQALELRLVTWGDEDYPPLLAQIESAPPVLFVRGTLLSRDELSVAIVGTRRCSPYGATVVESLASSLAKRGFTIVSGLAVGIDAGAHSGALKAGGRTIGVMACGLDIDYPKDNRELKDQIVASGAVVGEYALGTPPLRERFPARNRLISALALGLIVVEAPAKSGALITADHALDQGREVFAVPGPVDSPLSRGSHRLIKEGARLVETAEDVVDGLGMLLEAVPEREPQKVLMAELSGDEAVVIEAMSHQPRHQDQISADAQLPPARVAAALMLLEVKGLARRFPGNVFVRL